MYNDEFEDTFGISGEDEGFTEDEMDDMLWEDEIKSNRAGSKKQQKSKTGRKQNRKKHFLKW